MIVKIFLEGVPINFQILVHHNEQTIVFSYIVVMLSLFNTVISLSL